MHHAFLFLKPREVWTLKKYKIHVCLHSENCKLTIDWWYNIVVANG